MNYYDELYHEGVSKRDGAPIGSGRYPLGSGENPYQRTQLLYGWASDLKEQGYSAKDISDIAKTAGVNESALLRSLKRAGYSEDVIKTAMGIKTERYRALMSIASENEKAERDALIWKYINEDQMSDSAIAKKMNIAPTTIHSIRERSGEHEKQGNMAVANALKDALEKTESGMLDVGKGTEEYIGVSRTRLKNALDILKEEGYNVYTAKAPQVFTGEKTTMLVLTNKDVEWKQVQNNLADIGLPNDFYALDNGEKILKVKPPSSLDSKRIGVRYAEEGGTDKDGVIELRRNVPDLSLGNSSYAQVRIKVDGTHYIKGMAVYSDDLPDGIDVLVNTNKKLGTPLLSPDKEAKQVLKPLKVLDPNSTDPFGASLAPTGQYEYIDKDGKLKLSPINKINEEGKWGEWGKSLPAQFLSKQSPSLARQQLKLAYDDKIDELNEINTITNPTIRKKLLDDFAGGCDTDSVTLKAAAMVGQRTHVILPVLSLKDNEVYAPNYENGERVILIRYPHAGKFEIPELTVNNNNKEGQRVIGKQAVDAIGIRPIVAAQLSGADYDGDTVVVIPNNSGRIKTEKMIESLSKFDNKAEFPYREGMKVMSKRDKQIEMGRITNLIQDMTTFGAGTDEIVRAVKHSMVVIDAEKHKLDYKLSEKVFDIASLRKKYQEHINPETGKLSYGPNTLMTLARSEARIPQRRVKYVSEMTPDELKRYKEGELIFKETGAMSDKKNKETGEWTKVPKLQKVPKMALVSDATKLISPRQEEIELIYANYANQMKALANYARKQSIATPNTEYSPAAAKVYAAEVERLKAAKSLAARNQPKERRAQAYANLKIREAKENDPTLYDDADKLKKIKANALAEGRAIYGAKHQAVSFTPREWEAINAGAISSTLFSEIIRHVDADSLRKMALPQNTTKRLSNADMSAIKRLLSRTKADGTKAYSMTDLAKRYGVSVSTIQSIAKA